MGIFHIRRPPNDQRVRLDQTLGIVLNVNVVLLYYRCRQPNLYSTAIMGSTSA